MYIHSNTENRQTETMRKSYGFAFIITALVAITAACDVDYRERAKGNIREVFVVMDSTKWETSATAQAIEQTFGRHVETLPGLTYSPYYDIIYTDIRSKRQLERIRSMKNVIFVSPIDDSSNVAAQIRAFLDDGVESRVRSGESFAFPIQDQWYKDQYVLILSSTSDSVLAEKIINSEQALLNNMLEKELSRWNEFVYEKKEPVELSDSLWQEYGFKVRFQHDYHKRVDTLNFQTYRRYLPENDRWMWVWHKNNVRDISFLDDDWINATRDSLMQQFIKGSRDDQFISTEYRRPVETSTFQMGRLLVYETLGTWQMINGAQGGPFVNFTYYDPATSRLFMVEYSQFAPGVEKKLPFVRQFRSMGRTFESDSTWTSSGT